MVFESEDFNGEPATLGLTNDCLHQGELVLKRWLISRSSSSFLCSAPFARAEVNDRHHAAAEPALGAAVVQRTASDIFAFGAVDSVCPRERLPARVGRQIVRPCGWPLVGVDSFRPAEAHAFG